MGDWMASTVLVTGGSGAIGRAICCRFGAAGWHVAVHYSTRLEAAEQTCSLVKDAGGEALPYQADVRDATQVARMIEQVAARSGTLDVLIANAGQASSRLLLRHPNQDWAEVIETNLTGAFHCLRAAGGVMVRQRAGSVVLIGSHAAFHGGAGQAAYAAAKAGLLGLMKSTAREWGSYNVRVNMMLPGWQKSPMAGAAVPMDNDQLSHHLLGRTPGLESVATAIYTLALMPDASGQIWNLDSRIL
jgi:3-oxoacyl-[acyl-carrier protein] reductase